MKPNKIAISLADEVTPFGKNGTAVATRKNSIDFFSMLMDFPNPDTILKKLGKNISEYSKLKSDAQVSACTDQFKAHILRFEWRIVGEDKRRVALAEDSHKFLDDKKRSLKQLFNQELDAYFFGYQPMENMWAKINGMVMASEIRPIPAHWFKYGGENELRLLTQADFLYGIDVDKHYPGKFMVATNNYSYNDPYGEAKYSTAYWPKIFKGTDLKYWIKFMEKFSIPWLVGKYAPGTSDDDQDDLAQALEDAIQDGVIVIPDDSTAQILTPSDGRGTVFKDHIDAMNSEIKKGLLGNDMSGENKKTGTYAESRVGLDRERINAEACKQIIESVHNEYIQLLMKANFAEKGEIPRFELYEPDDDFDPDRVNRDKVVSESFGYTFSPGYLARAYGYEEGDIIKTSVPVFPAEFSESSQRLAPLRARQAVRRAVVRGDLANLKDVTVKCKLCDQRATVYDHRDYAKPLMVRPLCASCNLKKGRIQAKGIDLAELTQDEVAEIEQGAIDELSAAVTGKDIGETMIQPIANLLDRVLRSGGDYEDFSKALPDVFPEIDSQALEDTLTNLGLSSETWGRLNANS